MLQQWLLDPGIVYLNHGTVGAPPRRVLAAQQAIRDEIERQPSRYLLRDLVGLGVGVPHHETSMLRRAARAVAAFLGAGGDDLVFVENVTTGINAVLRSLDLREGDEILTTDHVYGAVANAAAYAARRCRARVVSVEIPYPTLRAEAVVGAVAAAIGPRTRLAIIDHVTSETALVLPVGEIAALCRARGVPVLVDGAHAPGAIPLDIESLEVDWYAANLHKWAHAPRSCGFLWAAPGRHAGIHPPVISWGLDQGFLVEFDWSPTRDPSPFLAAPEGIACLTDWGFEAVYSYNHGLAWEAAQRLSRRWGTPLGTGEAMVGSMVTLPLPERFGSTPDDSIRLRDVLLFEDRIEVQIHPRQGRLWIRISAQIYNDGDDIERLGSAIDAR